jgi:uncharacterized protein YdeI (YjbR/CyaY-like superfamily)
MALTISFEIKYHYHATGNNLNGNGITMNNKNPMLDDYLHKAAKAAELRPRSVMLNNAKRILRWHEEFEKLRTIVLSLGLTEEIKWGQPCYTLDGKNIILIHGAKDYCALAFFKGALLKDPQGILIQQTENVQAAREVRFNGLGKIAELEPILKSYIEEAIKIEKAGLTVPHKETKDFEIVAEFQKKLDEMPALKTAFESLTPGRQRAYLFYFSQAKQSETRAARVEKYIPQILDGIGLNDKSSK